jgi:hypothetical protein
LKRIIDKLTQPAWDEGFYHGVNSAYLQLAKEIKQLLKDKDLADFSSDELKLGFDHARHLVLERLNELEGKNGVG